MRYLWCQFLITEYDCLSKVELKRSLGNHMTETCSFHSVWGVKVPPLREKSGETRQLSMVHQELRIPTSDLLCEGQIVSIL